MKPLIVSTARPCVGHPRDVVGAAVVLLARPVEADQGVERRGGRRRRHVARGLEVRHDARDRRAVASADAIHLLAQPPIVVLHQPRVQRVGFLEPFEIGRRHVRVEVVGARHQDVLARRRRLARDHRPVRLVEEVARMRVDEGLRRRVRPRAARARRSARPSPIAASNCSREISSTNLRDVMCSYGPELIQNSFVYCAIASATAGSRLAARLEQRLERVAHHEGVFVALVVVDVAAGQRGLVEVPRELLVARRQRGERIGVELHHGSRADPFQQVSLLAHGQDVGPSATRSRCCGM